MQYFSFNCQLPTRSSTSNQNQLYYTKEIPHQKITTQTIQEKKVKNRKKKMNFRDKFKLSYLLGLQSDIGYCHLTTTEYRIKNGES